MLPLHPAEEKPPCTNRACHSSVAFAGNIFQLISLDSVWDEMTITFPFTLKQQFIFKSITEKEQQEGKSGYNVAFMMTSCL